MSNEDTQLTTRIVRTPTEARQGITPGIVRYVLGISLSLTIIAMILVGALMSR
jgi:hypothetical protein